ncbi:MAG: T9SS type A sorting domain-containing protein [candidate division Zixibacteria bacterium]|nr:T9SS type A sorting domain-containing protein [candidate division Zixibacteria bacterium]
MKKILLGSFLLGILLSANAPAIEVSGDVWGEWTSENNPYEVVEDLTVPVGSSLFIRPGCYIEFQGHFSFTVSGAELRAIGSEDDSIYFTANDTITGWDGLRLINSILNSELRYCSFRYGIKSGGPGDPENATGGNLFLNGSDITISNCVFTNGSVIYAGGGLSIIYSSPSIYDCVFQNNYCGSGGSGGAIYFGIGSGGMLSDCIIKNNEAYKGGGGILVTDQSTVTIINSEITMNTASELSGGGICCINGSPVISNNVIADNIAGTGGGISISGSYLEVNNNTIYGNEAKGYGGGFFIVTSNPIIKNTIVWNNSAPDGANIWLDGSAIVTYSDIQGGFTGEGNIDADPLFTDPSNGDFHLTWENYPPADSTKSPCIDTGDPNDPVPQGGGYRIDMGAFEFIHRLVIVFDINDFKFEALGDSIITKDFKITSVGASGYVKPHCDSLWVSFEPDSVNLTLGDTVTVTAIFDASGLDCRTFASEIYFESDAPGLEDVTIPVEMTVWTAVDIDVNIPNSNLQAGDTLSAYITVTNPTYKAIDAYIATAMMLPNDVLYGPVFGPFRIGLLPYGALSGRIDHVIPSYAMLGDYEYLVRVSPKANLLTVMGQNGAVFSVYSSSGLATIYNDDPWEVYFTGFNVGDYQLDRSDLENIPQEFILYQNNPNPFNTSTKISFALPNQSDVRIDIYNLAGQKIETLIDRNIRAGHHNITWDASTYSSGVYFYKLTANNKTQTKRMTLMK